MSSEYGLVVFDDAELLKRWSEIRRIIAMGLCREHLEETVYRRLQAGLQAGHLHFWGIMRQSDEGPELVGGGTTAFFMDPFLREMVLSVYSIYTSEQVDWDGFAEEALPILVDFAKERKCCRIVAQCNEASEIFAERNGFKRDAVMVSLEL